MLGDIKGLDSGREEFVARGLVGAFMLCVNLGPCTMMVLLLVIQLSIRGCQALHAETTNRNQRL